MQYKYLNNNGIKISYFHHYDKHLSNKAIIIIHAVGSNNTSMKHIINFYIKKGYEVIAPDLRCHGKSSRGKINMKEVTKDIRLVMSRINSKNITILTSCISFNLIPHILDDKRIKKIIGLSFTNLKYARFGIKLYYILGHLLFLWIALRQNFSNPRYTDWEHLRYFKLIKHMKRVYINMKFTDYLLFQKLFLNSNLNFKNINKKTYLIFCKNDFVSNLRKITNAISSNNNIKKIIFKGNHSITDYLYYHNDKIEPLYKLC